MRRFAALGGGYRHAVGPGTSEGDVHLLLEPRPFFGRRRSATRKRRENFFPMHELPNNVCSFEEERRHSLIALSAANLFDILGCNGRHADGPGETAGPDPSRHGDRPVSSFHPRLRPHRHRPDDQGETAGLKPADRRDPLTDGEVDFPDAMNDRQRERLERPPGTRRRGPLVTTRHASRTTPDPPDRVAPRPRRAADRSLDAGESGVPGAFPTRGETTPGGLTDAHPGGRLQRQPVRPLGGFIVVRLA